MSRPSACIPLTLALLLGQRDELGAKYQLVKQAEDAREGWEAVYESSLHACMHGANCTQGRDCQVGPSGEGRLVLETIPSSIQQAGRRLSVQALCDLQRLPLYHVGMLTVVLFATIAYLQTWFCVFIIFTESVQETSRGATFRNIAGGFGNAMCDMSAPEQVGRRLTRVTILAGSIVRVWGSLEAVLERYQGMLSRSDRTMRVVRADFGAHGSLIGVSHSYDSVK